jgi:SynChlorMet cassette radical SAM/SPASM protein ScmF
MRMENELIELPAGIPRLQQYYIYLTAGCNLACRHCWISPQFQPNGGTGGHLDFDLFNLAIKEGLPLGLKHVKLTGGEPLLHPDFFRILDVLHEQQLGVTIETNATLLSREVAYYLREHSSLNHISVSLDGATAATHDPFRGVKGSFEKAVQGIKNLVEVGYPPQVIMSLHIGNMTEIEALVKLAEGLGASSVKFNLIQPTGRGEAMAERTQVLDINQLVETGNWIEKSLAKRISIPLMYSWPIAFNSLTRILSQAVSQSCSIFSILGVLSTGDIAMCGIGVDIPELIYGRLGKDEMKDVWINHPTLNALRRDLPGNIEGICANCMFRNQCLGACVAENYHQSRQLTAPFWFCQQAYENNLFPVARMKQPGQAKTFQPAQS